MLPLNTSDIPENVRLARSHVLEVLNRVAEVAASGVAPVDHHDPIGVVEGQAPQQDRVDEREDGAVGADAERERERPPPA